MVPYEQIDVDSGRVCGSFHKRPAWMDIDEAIAGPTLDDRLDPRPERRGRAKTARHLLLHAPKSGSNILRFPWVSSIDAGIAEFHSGTILHGVAAACFRESTATIPKCEFDVGVSRPVVQKPYRLRQNKCGGSCSDERNRDGLAR